MRPTKSPRCVAVAGGLLLGAALCAGCVAGYRLGSTLPAGIRTVHVPTFVNNTGEPQAEIATTRAAIEEFQKDGTLRVAGPDRADAVLTATLVRFELIPLRYERDRAKTTREYRLLLTADIVFTRKGTTAPLLEKRVWGESTFEPVGDLSSAKLDALPDAAQDLAHDIVESIVEFW